MLVLDILKDLLSDILSQVITRLFENCFSHAKELNKKQLYKGKLPENRGQFSHRTWGCQQGSDLPLSEYLIYIILHRNHMIHIEKALC